MRSHAARVLFLARSGLACDRLELRHVHDADLLAIDLQAFGFFVEEAIDRVVLIFDRLLGLVVGVDFCLWNYRVLSVARVLKDACNSVVIVAIVSMVTVALSVPIQPKESVTETK